MQPEQVLLIPDSAEPKSNDELTSYGISLVPCVKGAGSVNRRIDYIQDQTVYITKRSINLIKEKDNYAWMIDKKTGETLNEPIDMWNHGMDAGGYAMESLKPQDNDEEPPDDSDLFINGNY
jgi:phage terminase large subunit